MQDDYSLSYGKTARQPARRYSYERRLGRILATLKDKNLSLLDIGSATADYAIDLKNHGASVTCLDVNHVDLKNARQKDTQLALVRGTASSLPFNDSSFDAIMILNAFRYFHDQESALAECQRVIRKNGDLYLIEHNRLCPDTLVFRKDVFRYSSMNELVKMIRNHGFVPEEHEMVFVPPPFLRSAAIPRLAKIADLVSMMKLDIMFPEMFIRAVRRS